MDDSPTSPGRTRRISLDSTSTSEFEVVSRERSTSGSTIGESNSSDDSMSAQKSSPSSSFNMPPLYSGYESNGQSSTRVSDLPSPEPIVSPRKASKTHSQSSEERRKEITDSLHSSLSHMGRETTGMLEQVLQELSAIKSKNCLLEKMALQSNEWRSATEQLEDQNKKLLKSLKSFKTREEELVDEVNRLQREKDEFVEKAKTAANRSAESSSSWLSRLVVIGIVVAAVAMYIDCHAQLIKEQRNSDVLREKLELMDELVERLEAERIKEYQRGVDEASKQVANDMSADIALARKERELEHERLIEAYREKMRLYDDLAAMKKAAKMEKEVLLADVTLSRKNLALNDSSILFFALTCL
ncbi:hypothetical protein Q1695_011122 [Nippostrongylus brasiliensis]|nr:hypothetical protein Q1695_011122 [Nippostrongylus brasiliensis]